MIPVFEHEIRDNVADLIKSTTSFSFNQQINAKDLRLVSDKESITLDLLLGKSLATNLNQFDLFYLDSILASIGWNKNTDVFLKEYTWAARNTPVDKPFNFMHNELDIIGHITASKVIDSLGNLIPDNTNIDDVPNLFDILVTSVIYKVWSDTERQKLINNFISEIQEGKWFVSMECLFHNFDYALRIPGQTEFKVVARDNESSFLTKYLKFYGGTGVFKEYEIGRVLKDFSFSGKGLVNNPANPRSHILSSYANDSKKEEKIMAEERTISIAQYEDLKAELAKAKQLAEQAVAKEIDELKASVTKAGKDLESLQSELSNVKSLSQEKDVKIKSLEGAVASANEKLEAVNKELSAANETLTKVQADALKAKRVSMLVSAGLDSAKAESVVEKFASASDEMFEEVVALHKVTKSEDMSKDKMKDEKKEDNCKADLDSAKVEDKEVSLASKVDDESDDLAKSVAGWLSDLI